MARFVIPNHDNTFDVLEGVQLNAEPLDRAAADRLAQRGGRVPHSYSAVPDIVPVPDDHSRRTRRDAAAEVPRRLR
jgi:hypothetical protein